VTNSVTFLVLQSYKMYSIDTFCHLLEIECIGNRYIRSALHLPSLSVIRHNEEFKQLYERVYLFKLGI
jgi:hypothetical protein